MNTVNAAELLNALSVVVFDFVRNRQGQWQCLALSGPVNVFLDRDVSVFHDDPTQFLALLSTNWQKDFHSDTDTLSEPLSLNRDFDPNIGPSSDSRWLRLSATLNPLPAGGVQLRGTLSDITDIKMAQAQTREENQQLFRMLDSFPGFAYLQAPDYSIQYANERFIKQFGEPQDNPCFSVIAGRNAPCTRCPTFEVFEDKQFVHWRADNTKDGRIYDVFDVPFFAADGQKYVLEYGIDVTEQVAAEKTMQLHSSVFQYANEAMLIANDSKQVIAANPAFEHATGFSEAEVLGKSLVNVSFGQPDGNIRVELELALNSCGHWRGEVWRTNKQGQSFASLQNITKATDQKGNTTYIATFTNITEIAENYIALQKIAHLDCLTGLPNRFLLNDRLEQAIKSCDRDKRKLAVIYIDLDGFKQINDIHGHSAGDFVLLEVAQRIESVLRMQDTVSRVGGDEFVALLPSINHPCLFLDAVKRIQDVLTKPLIYQDRTLTVEASIGACVYPDEAQCRESLLERADKAMFCSKHKGKNCFTVYHHNK